MKVFSADYLNKLTAQAQNNLRKRQHCNIHESYADPCQRLFNAIEPDSYIPPHRHATDPKDELLIAVRGSMALVTFDEQGMVTGVVRFGADRSGDGSAVGAEVAANTWHTVIALEPACVLLEVKAGPFDPKCHIPDDCIAPSRAPFLMARDVMRIISAEFKHLSGARS